MKDVDYGYVRLKLKDVMEEQTLNFWAMGLKFGKPRVYED